MTLTVFSGVIALFSILWLVMNQSNDGKRKNAFAVVMLVFSFPAMIAGGVMDMRASDDVVQLAEESAVVNSVDAVPIERV